jgi:hypothetical protein
MVKKLSESVSGSTELVFPDDTGGETYSLTELSVFDAEEVREELETDIPQYGSWLPVTITETGEEGYLSAPAALRKELLDASIRPAEQFRIVTMEKTGRDPSDPYRVELEFPERDAEVGQQTGLADD